MKYIKNVALDTYRWAERDFKEWPLRFVLEITAWFMSIGCTIWMGATLPNPPFLYLYPLIIIQCMIFGWAAWTRRSTGMVANYLLIVTIDIVALIRLISIQ
jgi:hypothetical protein